METKKKRVIGGVAALLVLFAAGLYFFQADAAIGNLNIYKGSADIVRSDSSIPGRTGDEVQLTDSLKVKEESRASLILKDNSIVRFEAGTDVVVSDIAYKDGKLADAAFELRFGKIWAHVEPLAPDGEFKVETPTVLAAVRGTNFEISYDGSMTVVYVGAHAVWVSLRSDPGNYKEVQAGQQFMIRDAYAREDFERGPEIMVREDEWAEFNAAEDAPVEPDIDLRGSVLSATTTQTSSTAPAPKPTGTSLPPKPTSTAPVQAVLQLSADNYEPVQNTTVNLSLTLNGAAADVTKATWSVYPMLNFLTQGKFYTATPGIYTIQATLNGVKSNVITITVKEPALSRIAVSCTKTYGTTQEYFPVAKCTATGYYSNNTNANISATVGWSVTGTAGGTIDGSGTYTPKSQGTATVTAARNGVTGTATLSIP
jgi:hypothetical protein